MEAGAKLLMSFINCNEQNTVRKSVRSERPYCEHGKWVSNGVVWRSPRWKIEYRQAKRDKRRSWAIEYLGSLCGSCSISEQQGIDAGLGRFEFDHIIPETKDFDITRYLDCPKETLIPELDKCQLLHVECHKAKTAQEAGQRASAKEDQLEALINQYERTA